MQGTLDFSATRDPEPAELRRVADAMFGHHHKDASKTELAAAKRQVQVSGKKRMEVLRLIVDAGSVGITRHELSERGVYLPTACGRVRELLDGKWVYEKGSRQGRSLLFATGRGKKASQSSAGERPPAALAQSKHKLTNPCQGGSPSSTGEAS